jgi:hypothetical protein
MTKVTCPCCAGERYLFVVDAAFPDEPPTRQPCCHCGTTGYLKLTVSEAATYTAEVLPWRDNDEGRIIYDRAQEPP